MRNLIAAASALCLLASPAWAETTVGVTAAVNQQASGTVGGNIRTIALGENVVFNERIQTGGEGLVQILLADGTTFMVGPNSDLVIDNFVYDPNAGTAQVTATFTKGVLRFIGGQTSKTDGGVTINTPVGTMGIRGAMVDIDLDPPAGTPKHIDLLFGNSVTLEQGEQLLGRLYEAGYSLVLGEDGAFSPIKTPPGFGTQIQLALAGKSGTTGGAPRGPTDPEVENSEVAENNTPPDPAPELTQAEIDALLEAVATYDKLRDFIINNQNPQGFAGALLVDDGVSIPLMNQDNGTNGDAMYTEVAFDADGNPVRIKVPLSVGYPECLYACFTYQGGTEGGEVVAGDLGSAYFDGYLYDGNNVPDENLANQLAYELSCVDCNQFIRWGFWGFDGWATDSDYVEVDGMWTTGKLTTRAQLGNLAALSESGEIDAFYTGDAVGNVDAGEGGQYVATGDMEMTWNFADKAGTININDFDANAGGADYTYGSGIYLEGDVASVNGQIGFSGALSTEGGDGVVQGGFVNKGNSLAHGVMGDFYFVLGEGDYVASGVFFGSQTAPN
ncbi:MAG: FecR family protein [Devosia sp.]